MVRNLLIMTGLITMTAIAAAAQSNGPSPSEPGNTRGGPLDLGPTRYIYRPSTPDGPDEWKAGQIVRWGDVGKCVVTKDREASLSYVAAKRGSREAIEAAKRLEPAFGSCLAGSGVVARNNKAARRAAIADALGVRLSS